MPRKSREALSVVPMIPGAGRPQPPPELDEEESAHWRAIVGSMPPNWFKTESLPILRALIGHIVMSDVLQCRLRKDRHDMTLKDLKSITAMQNRETQAIVRLSAALRLSQQSQYKPEATARRVENAKRSRPWDVRGEN